MTEGIPSPGPVTRLLLDWSAGDERARDDAGARVRRAAPAGRLVSAAQAARPHPSTTALVHEAYLRLVDQRQVNWKNRAQFVGLAAVMMRRILVNDARDRAAGKRDGDLQNVPLRASPAAVHGRGGRAVEG